MKTVIRSDTHRIDTLALRTILADIPADWLIRSVEERDYGIDLQIEIFDGNTPTGQIAHIQVKGVSKGFQKRVKLGRFPVRTLTYAERFTAPFFLFYTSIEQKETRFVWLQKYASAKLEVEKPNWRNQDWITIDFPSINSLKLNFHKINEILRVENLREDGVKFIAAYEWLKIFTDNADNQKNVTVLEQALEMIPRLRDVSDFIAHHGETLFELSVDSLEKSLNRWRANINDGEARDEVLEQIQQLFLLKMAFVDRDEMDEFTVETSSNDAHPY